MTKGRIVIIIGLHLFAGISSIFHTAPSKLNVDEPCVIMISLHQAHLLKLSIHCYFCLASLIVGMEHHTFTEIAPVEILCVSLLLVRDSCDNSCQVVVIAL